MTATLTVLSAAAASIQGLGIYGGQRYGIAPGGAMDRLALAEANAVVDRPAGAASVEIGPLPARFRITGAPVRVAFAGARREITIDGTPLPPGQSARAADGATITVHGPTRGQYSYLAFEGGLLGCTRDGSTTAATSERLRSWVLQPRDRVALATAHTDRPERRLRLTERTDAPIRVVLGPQHDYFSASEILRFLSTPWSISHAANRMAYLLEGGRITAEKGHNIISDGTVTGHIQIAGSGQPIVILCDRGTVGGYPKIATVITADLGRLAQLTHADRFFFQSVGVVEAQVLAREFAARLARVRADVAALPSNSIAIAALYETNLAGDAFDAVAWTRRASHPSAVEEARATR